MKPTSLPTRTACALIASILLTACSIAADPHSAPAMASRPNCPPQPGAALSLNEVVQYYTCIASLPGADLSSEYASLRDAYSRTGSDSDRIRLAMLLSLPNTTFHSIPDALKLLQDPPGSPASPPTALHNLARMLSMIFAEQQKESDTLDQLAKALAAEKAHSEFLQGKIDAVKNLEINMIHRDQP